MASTSNQGPNPNRGRKRRRPSTAAVVAGTVGKVLGTFLLICVITGAILLCFAAVYIKTVIIPQAHLEANFVMNQTSTIYHKDSTTGEYVEHLSLHGTENRQLVDFEEIPDNLINATVAIEDETFWKHHGVNWKRTLKGVLLMFTDGVSVVDMAAAYSVFPRNGLYVEPRTYTKVTRVLDDGTEEVLLDNTQNQPEAVLSEETTWYINDMLKNVVTGKFGGATGTRAQLSGMTVAGKTGTTNSNNDKWFVGYTPYYTAAVWVGYNNPERISSSNNPAVSMWKKVMAPIHEGLENKSFPAAGSEQKSVSICMDSGLRATEACLNDPRGSRARTFTLFSDDVPAETCSLHKEVEVCTGSPVLGGDGTAIEGLYHLAGEFCPRQADEGAGVTEGTVKTIGILDYSRESVGGAAAKDSSYLYSFLEAQGTCDVHTTAPQPQEPEEYDPNSFVISDPSTWPPVNDPRYENFDPENPATWPNAGQPSETPSPGESGQPNPPETSTSPTPSPVPTPVETPPDEPYIPADGTK